MPDPERLATALVDRSPAHSPGSRFSKNPELLPTPSLSWEEFEDFTERLLSAHRFCSEQLRHVRRVERWGRRGDRQDGIDFEGEFTDGASASWQCKRQDALTPADVRAAVRACTFEADKHHLVYSGEASRDARDEMAKHPKWELIDQRGLGRLLEDLPLHKRRDVLDATWGTVERKRLLELPGEDAFLSLDAFAADRRDPATVLNDLGRRVGRDVELEALGVALDRTGDWPAVVIIKGAGGRGKTRLVVEALKEFQRSNREVPVLCLSPGRVVDDAALAELPYTPAVIVVDDAHQDPASVTPLLRYMREVDGTQLVLCSRPSGAEPIRFRALNARYVESQLRTIEVGELRKSQARALVQSVTDGLNLTWAVSDYFAAEAVHSPYVAVIAANLLRRGELTMPLVVDRGLREQVLARFEELAAGEVDGVPTRTVQRLLAVYAALGAIDDSDQLRLTIGAFCGLQVGELLRLRRALLDRGVLVERGGLVSVVPDVLADEILEREAAVHSDATGFVEELWAEFGGAHLERLVIALAELDWRLTRQGGPRVFARVWGAVRLELSSASYAGLAQALDGLGGLAFTQPDALVEALEEIRDRLDVDEVERRVYGTSTVGTDGRDLRSPTDGADRFWWRRQVTADDVRQRMPDLYGQCAVSAPQLLETVLDALWALQRSDTRPENQHPGHPARVITDRLANLGRLSDPSFPARIVDRVRSWTKELDVYVDPPLPILRPLLAKSGETHVLEGRRKLVMQSFPISPVWARPFRDAVREALLDFDYDVNLRAAAAGLDLLGNALRPPQGLFGRLVSREEVLAWEDDDLATMAVLKTVAAGTTSGVVRRMLRNNIAWTAEHARSLELRHSGLVLVAELDSHDDLLAEVLLHHRTVGDLTRRDSPPPTLEELRNAQESDAVGDVETVQADREALRNARIRARVDDEQSYRQELVERVVLDLARTGDSAYIVATLDQTSREIRSALPARRLSCWPVWRQLELTRPDLVRGTTLAIAAAAKGPLDDGLDQLLNAWAVHDEGTLIDWLTYLAEQRDEVRLAVATAFINYGWTDLGSDFLELFERGTRDPAADVRERFLIGAHRLLATAPAETVEALLAQGISTFAAARVIEHACGFEGANWGEQLSEQDARAVLDLVRYAEWQEYALQQVVSGIAKAHPLLVLNNLEAAQRVGELPSEMDGLAAAFDEQADALVAWLLNQASTSTIPGASEVVTLAVGHGPTASQAQALEAAIKGLPGDALMGISALLRAVIMWPTRQPELAQQLLQEARAVDAATARSIRDDIAGALHLGAYGWTNGVSEELNEAIAAATSCAESESDPELREEFEQARTRLEQNASWLLNRHAETEDDD